MWLYGASQCQHAGRIEVLLGSETVGYPRNNIRRKSRFPHGFDAAFAKLLWPHTMLLRFGDELTLFQNFKNDMMSIYRHGHGILDIHIRHYCISPW